MIEKFRSTHPLIVAFLVGLAATLLSRLTPPSWSASLVGFLFLLATYLLCVQDAPDSPGRYGLDLGGFFANAPLSPRRIASETLRAAGIAALVACLIFPVFHLGFRLWHEPRSDFSWELAFLHGTGTSSGWLDLALGHLLVVALPEEAFFRGYLQTRLAERRAGAQGSRATNASIQGILITSLVFALGHLATTPHPARLAVFFPSLLFGALRTWTKGIGSSVFLHAFSNLYSVWVAAGYGYY